MADYTITQGPADTWTIPTGSGEEAVVGWLPHPDWPSQYRLAYIVEGHPDKDTQYVGGIAESIVVECDPDAPEGARAAWWVGTRPDVEPAVCIARGYATCPEDAEMAVAAVLMAVAPHGLRSTDRLEWAPGWPDGDLEATP